MCGFIRFGVCVCLNDLLRVFVFKVGCAASLGVSPPGLTLHRWGLGFCGLFRGRGFRVRWYLWVLEFLEG